MLMARLVWQSCLKYMIYGSHITLVKGHKIIYYCRVFVLLPFLYT